MTIHGSKKHLHIISKVFLLDIKDIDNDIELKLNNIETSI